MAFIFVRCEGRLLPHLSLAVIIIGTQRKRDLRRCAKLHHGTCTVCRVLWRAEAAVRLENLVMPKYWEGLEDVKYTGARMRDARVPAMLW